VESKLILRRQKRNCRSFRISARVLSRYYGDGQAESEKRTEEKSQRYEESILAENREAGSISWREDAG